MKKRRVYHCWELERSSSGASSGPTQGELVNVVVAPGWEIEQRAANVVVTAPGTQSCRHGLLPVHCPLCGPGPESEIPAMPPHPADDGSARPGWISKWEFERAGGERVRIVVVASRPNGEEETIDAREFIERLGDAHEGTVFVVHVETGSDKLAERCGCHDGCNGEG